MKQVGMALIGLGTVGSGVYKTVEMQKSYIEHKEGISLTIKKVLALDYALKIPDWQKAKDYHKDIIADESIDIVVELIGGINPAREFVLAALALAKRSSPPIKSL